MKEKFPGFKKCMKMMRDDDPWIREDGFHWLLPNASDHVHELIEAFQPEEEIGLRCWLMELIDNAMSEDAFEFLSEQLRSNSPQFQKKAMRGLKHLNTKESRTLLWDARSWEFDSAEVTEKFRIDLTEVQSQDW